MRYMNVKQNKLL